MILKYLKGKREREQEIVSLLRDINNNLNKVIKEKRHDYGNGATYYVSTGHWNK